MMPLWRWLLTTSLPLLVLLLGQWRVDVDVLRAGSSQRLITTFFAFLALYPLCYVFGLSLANRRGPVKAIADAVAALGSIFGAGILLSIAVIWFSASTFTKWMLPAIVLAGAAYGLAIDRLQERLFGYPAGSRRVWFHLHWACGMLASLVAAASASMLVVNRPSILYVDILPAAYWAASLPHLVGAWYVLRRDSRAGSTPTVEPTLRLRTGGRALGMLVIGLYVFHTVYEYHRRPPLIVAEQTTRIPVGDRVYALPGHWIVQSEWSRADRQFSYVTLSQAFGANAMPEPATTRESRIRIRTALSTEQNPPQTASCYHRAFGNAIACWPNSVPPVNARDNGVLVEPPRPPDFTTTLNLPRVLLGKVFILAGDRRILAGLNYGGVFHRPRHPYLLLIVPDGQVWWHVPLVKEQLPLLDGIIMHTVILQTDLAALP